MKGSVAGQSRERSSGFEYLKRSRFDTIFGFEYSREASPETGLGRRFGHARLRERLLGVLVEVGDGDASGELRRWGGERASAVLAHDV